MSDKLDRRYVDALIHNLTEHTLDQRDGIRALEADRNEWMVKADKATALASEYLRERDRYREIVREAATFPCRAPDPPCPEVYPDTPERWCMTCRASFALNREE